MRDVRRIKEFVRHAFNVYYHPRLKKQKLVFNVIN